MPVDEDAGSDFELAGDAPEDEAIDEDGVDNHIAADQKRSNEEQRDLLLSVEVSEVRTGSLLPGKEKMCRWLCCACLVDDAPEQPENQYLNATKPFPNGNQGNFKAFEGAKNDTPQKFHPIEAPALSLEELKEAINNFGPKDLIGEGSYGRVYYATLSNGSTTTIKKLDVSSQPKANPIFLA